MPSRRISSNDNLAVVQEIAVNPYSSYNSDNVNMLTRMVTGEKNKDFITKGLDAKGVNRLNTEVLDSPLIHETFPTLSAFNTNWVNSNFSWDAGTQSAKGSIQGVDLTETVILQSVLIPITPNVGYWFKVQFDLINTPKQLFIQYGSESKTYDHPASGSYTFYVQLYNNTNTFEPIKFVGLLDSQDQYSDTSIYLDNIILTKVINRGIDIEPIALPPAESPDITTSATLNPNSIPLNMIHPHAAIKAFPGVCVKDEAMINILGLNPSDPATPVLTLNYNDSTSWIKGITFGSTDFPTIQTTYYIEDGGIPTATSYDVNGNLLVTLWDDGENPGHYRKINGQSGTGSGEAYVKWAYLVVYYSYFKNPNPNKSYIGLATEDEINDPRYGDDYLILAKLRFIDARTVDAIIYYPERHDWQLIDATQVSYLHLNQLKHWLDKPMNTSLALDLLASRIYNFKGVLFFPTHQQFQLWISDKGGSGTGTGNGPKEFLQWLGGADPDNEYDLMAFVAETNTFWRSRIQLTGIVHDIEIVSGGSNYTAPTVRINSANGEGSGASVSSVALSSNVITAIHLSSGGTGYLTIPDIEILDATGTGAQARANIQYNTSNYKVAVDWVEISPKRFEINWSTLPLTNGWPTSKPSTWEWHRLSDSDATVTAQPTYRTLAQAKASWPNEFYIERGTGSNASYTIVNPNNPSGRGIVPGPITNVSASDVATNKFLRSDGMWANGGAQDLHFEAKGYLTPTDNLVQGMVGHDGLLKGIHIWSDVPITTPQGNGLKVDVLLTKLVLPNGFSHPVGNLPIWVPASIFTDSTYSHPLFNLCKWGTNNRGGTRTITGCFITAVGSGYTNGTYTLTNVGGGTGSISYTCSGGVIVSCSVVSPGTGYGTNDGQYTINASLGSGSNGVIAYVVVGTGLDLSTFSQYSTGSSMPEIYT